MAIIQLSKNSQASNQTIRKMTKLITMLTLNPIREFKYIYLKERFHSYSDKQIERILKSYYDKLINQKNKRGI